MISELKHTKGSRMTYEEFKRLLDEQLRLSLSAHWDGTAETEQRIKEETQSNHTLYTIG